MHASSTASHLPNKNTDTIFGLGDDKETDRTPSNVHGWLMNVHGYREPSEPYDNNMRIPVSASQKTTRPLSISSISSEDSVNLDELIKANYTSDMDDETDLPDLATLDLDDSDEEFWKLDEATIHAHSKPQQRTRSGSISSENSMTSQSTITFNNLHVPPSNTSTSSISSSAASRSTSPNPSTPNMRRSLSSHPTRSTLSNTQSPPLVERTPSRLGLKRASHIPAPSSTSSSRLSFITPQRTLSTSSTSNRRQPTSSSSRLSSLSNNKRASHIPMTATSRARSPIPAPRLSTLGGGQHNSIFGSRSTTPQSGLRPPSRATTSTSSSTRSSSRLGISRRT
ncbi:hypothetical protein LRAMOSA04339 [Lichtheimia ramosa]|uniref:Uncharacterized protein n=1 Tax=Lichtheimia ramosa TaxID=688394 RepID=A0A077WY56_9FUNG|nr:hypothetical protein LRAMOSA04339 [Lichtheimia ramosa]